MLHAHTVHRHIPILKHKWTSIQKLHASEDESADRASKKPSVGKASHHQGRSVTSLARTSRGALTSWETTAPSPNQKRSHVIDRSVGMTSLEA